MKLDRIDKIFFGVPLASCHICVAEYCRNKPLTSFLVVYHRRMFPSNLLLLQSLKIIFFRSFFDFFEVFCHTTSSDRNDPVSKRRAKGPGRTGRHGPAQTSIQLVLRTSRSGRQRVTVCKSVCKDKRPLTRLVEFFLEDKTGSLPVWIMISIIDTQLHTVTYSYIRTVLFWF